MSLLLFSVPCPAQTNKIKEYETAVAKGRYYLETGDFSAAAKYFEQALAAKPDDVSSLISLGIIRSRVKEYAAAKSVLLKALAGDPANARARYELGVVMYNLGETGEARDFFQAVVDQGADNSLKTYAQKYVDLIDRATHPEKSDFGVTLSAGAQHDSNVILESNDPVASKTAQEDDWRAVFSLDGAYRFRASGGSFGEAGYQFFQSLHRKLDDFDIQQHAARLSGTWKASENIHAGMKYVFRYSLVGGDRYSSLHSVSPYVSIRFSRASQTQVQYIFESERFNNADAFPINDERTGTNNALAAAHTIRFGDSSLITLSYRFDVEDARVKFWSHTGHKGSAAYQGVFGGTTLSLAASYYDQRYDEIAPGFTDKRHDGAQEYTLDASRDVWKNISLVLSDTYIIHDSNLALYEYNRNIVGIFMVMRL